MSPSTSVVRRSKYGEDTVELICERLRRGEGLSTIARTHEMPCRDTIMKWLDSNRFGFRDAYLESKRVAAFLLAERLMDEAQNDENDQFLDENGVARPNHAAVQRSKLICDSIKWQVSKMLPKIYGDRMTQEHDVTGDLAELLKQASNKNTGLPHPINESTLFDGEYQQVRDD